MSELADRPVRVSEELFLVHWWRMVRWFSNLRLVPRWHEHRARLFRRLLRRLYYDGLSRVGKILFICSLLIFLFSYRSTSEFLLLTAAIGIGLLLWSVVLGFAYRPRVSIGRDTPNTAVVGQPLVSQISLINESPRALYNFSVREMVVPFGQWPREWARPHQAILPSGHQTTIAVQCKPQKRGLLTLSGVAVQTYFPFFLTRFTSRSLETAHVYVLPESLPVSIPSLRHIADTASKRLKTGSDAQQGPALEYTHSRQYQTGDPLRRLDHRASSRRGEPMSKIFEGADEIRRDQVHIMVDLTLDDFQRWQRRPLDEDPLDQRLALAVEIGLSAQNEGFSLAALALGRQWHELDNLLQFYQHIAGCRPQRAVTENHQSIPDALLSANGLHILIVGRWTTEIEARVESWQKQGILILVFLLAESPRDKGSLPVGNQFIEIQLKEPNKKAKSKTTVESSRQ